MPPMPAARASAATRPMRIAGSRSVFSSREHIEGEGQKRIADEDGGRLVDRRGGWSGGRAGDRRRPWPADRRGRGCNNGSSSTAAPARRTPVPSTPKRRAVSIVRNGPQALAAGERRVAHRLDQPLGPRDLARKRARRQQLRQRVLDRLACGRPGGFRIQLRSNPAPKTRRTRHIARPKWLAATRPQAVTGVSAENSAVRRPAPGSSIHTRRRSGRSKSLYVEIWRVDPAKLRQSRRHAPLVGHSRHGDTDGARRLRVEPADRRHQHRRNPVGRASVPAGRERLRARPSRRRTSPSRSSMRRRRRRRTPRRASFSRCSRSGRSPSSASRSPDRLPTSTATACCSSIPRRSPRPATRCGRRGGL